MKSRPLRRTTHTMAMAILRTTDLLASIRTSGEGGERGTVYFCISRRLFAYLLIGWPGFGRERVQGTPIPLGNGDDGHGDKDGKVKIPHGSKDCF